MSEEKPSPSDRLREFIGASLAGAEAPTQAPAEVTLPFLMFRHGTRWFGVRAESVRVVVAKESITRVPAQPSHILGVALIRSRLIPVVDLATLTGSADRPDDKEASLRLVVLASDEAEIALVANEARGVIHVAADTIGHAASGRASFISGNARWRRTTAAIIDTFALLSAAMRVETRP